MSDSVNASHRPEEKVPVPENETNKTISQIRQEILNAISVNVITARDASASEVEQFAHAALKLAETYRLLESV